jgi:hypothetical protein
MIPEPSPATGENEDLNAEPTSSTIMGSQEFSPSTDSPAATEITRVKLFLGIQFFFLALSVFTGGFHFKLWSMLDTALLIQSIGVTALVVVLEEARLRRLAFKIAIVLYLLGLLDMGINVLVSGVVGWHAP